MFVTKKKEETNFYLDTDQPQWLIDFEANPTSLLDLSISYKNPEFLNVDLTVTDSGMPLLHQHWLIKYLLPRAKIITELNLEGCNIGDSGLLELAEIFKTNTTLRKLNLKDNCLSARKIPKFLDIIEEYNFTLCSIEIDEGDKDAIAKNKNQYESFDLETVSSMLQANESEKDKILGIKKRVSRITQFNSEVVKCIDKKNTHLEMIFHGEKGRSSGNKAVELQNKRLFDLIKMVPHITSLTFERFYPYVPPNDGDRKWFENLDPKSRKEREEYDCVPTVIYKMTELKELNFFDCVDPTNKQTFFKKLPYGLSTLTSLKKLTISQCGLEELDLDVGNSYQTSASYDNIQKSIFYNSNLEILSIPGNRISRIPESIGLCTSLKSLRIYNNFLTELPYSILNLRNLEELICTGNTLRKIPLTLTKFCPNLNDLRILKQNEDEKKMCLVKDDKNQIKMRDAEEKCPRKTPFTQTINYMSKFLNTSNKIRLNRCKLMFIGDGAVGKTTTIKALTSALSKVKLEKEEELDNVATDGIDMQTLSVPVGFKHTPGHIGGSDCVNFGCWDFAGQDVYSYTHQFFLTEKAIYMIGFNIENALNPDGDPLNMIRVDYWLQSISMRFPSSPIIIFGTHVDSKFATRDQLKILHKNLTDKYVKNKKLKVVKVMFISNFTGKGVKDLLDEIKGICKNKRFGPTLTIDREINIKWTILEERGKSMRGIKVVPIISFDEWVKVAQNDAQIDDIEEIKKATQFLHDIGSLVWFDEEGLDDVVCLKPEFLADVFAAVISAKSGISSGILKHDLLVHIWRSFPIYLYPYMLALLEKFEITHRLEGDAINNTAISSALLVNDTIEQVKLPTEMNLELFHGSSIVPSLLPIFPPTETEFEKMWPKDAGDYSEIERVYQFDFVPNGFFSRLTVRLLHSKWNADILWRFGIVISKDMSHVYIKYDQDAKEITLKLRTRSEQYRFGPLLDSMNTLIEDWLKNTEIQIFIPVKLGDKTVKVDIKAIEKAASNGASRIKIENVDIRLDEIAPDFAVIDTGGSILEDDLKVESKIGEGGFAIVYRGTLNGSSVAVKRLNFKSGEGSSFSEIFSEFRREVWLMKSLQHENIVELKGICTKPSLTMVLEMMDGDLYNYIHGDRKLPPDEQIKLALDIAKGVNFMHKSQPPIIHRDLKSPNILIKKSPNSKYPIAKIADFGLSRGLVWSSKLDDKAVENPLWLAPEVLRKKPYTEKVDVYAFGVILYELVSGLTFFWEISFMSKVEEKILNGERPEIPPETLPDLKSLISRCWAQEMNDRPDFEEVIQILEKNYSQYDPSYVFTQTNDISKKNVDISKNTTSMNSTTNNVSEKPTNNTSTNSDSITNVNSSSAIQTQPQKKGWVKAVVSTKLN